MESKTAQSKSISVRERTQQYPPGVVYTDGHNLFCTACNLSLDHTRKSTIDRHFLSEKHKKRKADIDSYKGKESYERRRDVILDLTEAFVCAKIPLEKLDNPKLRAFLNKHVINAGSIPTSSQLRSEYLPQIADLHKTKSAQLEKCDSAVTDESTEEKDH